MPPYLLRLLAFVCLLIGCYASSPLQAATYYVRTDGNDSNSGTSSTTSGAWRTIGKAVEASLSAGDIVYIRSGTYNEKLDVKVQGTSANPLRFIADVHGTVADWPPGSVTLDASSEGEAIKIDNYDYVHFVGLTVRGKSGDNVLFLKECDGLQFEKCDFYSGGIGASIENATVGIYNCVIHDNGGDGIKMSGGTVTVISSTIANNSGDGIDTGNSNGNVYNSILSGNGGYGFRHQSDGDGTLNHIYNLLYSNASGNYAGTSTGLGEIFSDPQFVSTSDYHLRSTSPAINTAAALGSPYEEDFHSNPRPYNGGWDMGYHEHDSTRGSTQLLLVTRYDGYYTAQERLRKSSMEAWDYAVSRITSTDSQANFDSAVANVSLVYVPEESQSSDTSYKLRESTIGVVFDEDALADEFGLSTAASDPGDHTNFTITDNTHYITSPFSTGSMVHGSPTIDVKAFSGTLAPDLEVLGDWTSSPALGVVDTGGTLVNSYNGSNTAFGRRVGFMHGGSFDWSDLTADSLTLFRRSLEWAAEEQTLVAHWSFDEGSGTTIADAGGKGYDGSFASGTPVWTSGIRDGALEFNGLNDADTNDDFDPPASGSVALWYKFNSTPTGSQRLFGLGGDWEIRSNATGILYADLGCDGIMGGFQTPAGAAEAGRWHHIVAIYNDPNDSFKVYLDGELVANGSMPITAQSPAVLSFGTRTGSTERFDGALDDLRVYNYELSESEISELYGLIGHWKMDEGTGTTAADSTGYANDATLSGATWTSDCAGNYALEFDGSGGVATTGSNFDPPAAGTVAFWMRASGPITSRERLFGVNGNWEARLETTGTISFDLGASPYVGNEPFATTSQVVDEGRWYHIVATYDETDDAYSVYVNGVLDATGISPVDLLDESEGILSFGTRTGSTEYWEGALRDFRVYNRPISNEEIGELSGMIAHWRLNESSGSVADDAGVLDNDATFVASPTLGVPGPYPAATSTAVALNGSSQSINSGQSLLNDLSEFTIMGWVRPNSTTNDRSFFGQNDLIELGIDYASDQIDLWTANGGSINATVQLPYGKWSHITASGSGTELRLYVNGRQVASGGSSTANYGSNGYSFKVGEGVLDVSGDYFDGRVDDVRAYSRLLCPDDVHSVYKEGRPAGVRIIEWVEAR